MNHLAELTGRYIIVLCYVTTDVEIYDYPEHLPRDKNGIIQSDSIEEWLQNDKDYNLDNINWMESTDPKIAYYEA